MDTGGPFAFGEPPEELGGPGFGGVEPDAPQRGWLPPEDRLWRHPSELRSASTSAPEDVRRSRSANKWVFVTVGVVGVAAVASVVVAVNRLSEPSAGTARVIAASDTSLTTTPAEIGVGSQFGAVRIGPEVVQIVDTMRASLVTLLPEGGSSSAPRLTGVVLPGGNLVATAAAAVGSATRFEVVSADGRQRTGQLVGSDARSGVAVLRVPDHLTAASFADEEVQTHELALAACLCGTGSAARAGAADRPDPADVAVGMVRQAGTAATLDGGPSLLDAIEAEMPLGPASWGSVLLDAEGQVIGILDAQRDIGDDRLGYFVPAPLALGVADELADDHQVTRGWLGVVCADAPGGGAEVTEVLPGSPAAAAGLHPGDVVEAVDAHAVASLADLQARLYVSPPGTELFLTVLRGGTVAITPVVVANPS